MLLGSGPIAVPQPPCLTTVNGLFSGHSRFQSLNLLPELPLCKIQMAPSLQSLLGLLTSQRMGLSICYIPQYLTASFHLTSHFSSCPGLTEGLCEDRPVVTLKGSFASLGTLGMPVAQSVLTVGWSPSALSLTYPQYREHSAVGGSCPPAADGSNTPGCHGFAEQALAEGRDKTSTRNQPHPSPAWLASPPSLPRGR